MSARTAEALQQQFPKLDPIPEDLRKAFALTADEFGILGSISFSTTEKSSLERYLDEDAELASCFVPFASQDMDSLFAYWFYEGRTSSNAPIVYVSRGGYVSLFANDLRELLEIVAIGMERPGWLVNDQLEGTIDDLDETRARLKKEFGVEPAKKPKAIIDAARKAHPDTKAWIASFRANKKKAKKTPAKGKTTSQKTIETPGKMKLPAIAARLAKGQNVDIALTKAFEYAKAVGDFFSGTFELDEGLRDDLVAWFAGNEAAADRYVPFGHDGAHAIYALWPRGKSSAPIVCFGGEGEASVIAEDVRGFLALLALGHREVGRIADDASSAQGDADVAPFRAWLKKELGITPPKDGKKAIAAARKKHPGLDDEIAKAMA